MKLAIMQPYFFPYLGYFQLVSAVDKFIFFDDVNFINRGWINRNNILVNGKSHLFSISLKQASQNKLIKDVEIADETGWKESFLKKIELAYKKAPMYNDVFPLIRNVVEQHVVRINVLAQLSIQSVCAYLKIDSVFSSSSEKYNNRELKGQSRIIDICLKENATKYFNAAGGVDLYSKEIFESHNIELSFVKPTVLEYKQYSYDFVPGLSIIDVIMFNSVDKVQAMLDKYTII